MRPNYFTDRLYYAKKNYPDPLRQVKYYDSENQRMSELDKQLPCSGFNNSNGLQLTLESGIVFQMDKAAFKNNGLLS